jgi:hypothetical protein
MMRSNPLLHPLAAWRQHEHAAPAPPSDPAVARGRDAGGPVDEACYPCSCGCFFVAPVSADVTCPHCGATQAW